MYRQCSLKIVVTYGFDVMNSLMKGYKIKTARHVKEIIGLGHNGLDFNFKFETNGESMRLKTLVFIVNDHIMESRN